MGTLASVLFLLVLIAVAGIYLYGHAIMKAWVESPAGEGTASRGLSKAIKVDGEFAPLHLNGWTITTASFESQGWPGEAIGGLDAYGIRAEFDPAAIWDRAYRIKGIQIDHAEISLLPPNDKLKRKMPPKKPRPWYAFLLPNRFVCGPMVTPNATLDFQFQNEHARIHDAHVQADLIGKDLNYTATSGVLEFPYLPPLHIERLEMLVTRPLITVSTARLTALDPADPARLELHGALGMRENKSIDASVDLVDMPIEQILPAELASRIHGRASGHLDWKRDASGREVVSDGGFSLTGARIDDLSVFKQLALLHGNADLQNFTFETFTCQFHLYDGHFHAFLVARSAGRFLLTGLIDYELATKIASLDFVFTELPLKTWLPTEFKPRYTGVASATLKWHGSLATIKDSAGAVTLNLDGTHIHNPVLLRRMLAKRRLRVPDEINFKTAQLAFAYEDRTFHLTKAQLDVPGIITFSATGTLAEPENTLDATVEWQGLTLGNWLPAEMAEQISGDVNGHSVIHVRQWKLMDGSYQGAIELVKGNLRYTPVQSMLARFVKDRRLLDLPLTRASFAYQWNENMLKVTDIDLRGGDDVGIRGDMTITRGGDLSGVLWVGTRATYLRSLAGLGDEVFHRDEDGLHWARVALSGTVKKPKQDLSGQLMSQLGKHPSALFGLSGKLISWYVGDWFGAGEEWKKTVAK